MSRWIFLYMVLVDQLSFQFDDGFICFGVFLEYYWVIISVFGSKSVSGVSDATVPAIVIFALLSFSYFDFTSAMWVVGCLFSILYIKFTCLLCDPRLVFTVDQIG